jgi:hypothetical protein
MNIVLNSNGLIVMMSDGLPVPPEGGSIHTLTTEEEVALSQLMSAPNGGITFVDGAFTALPVPPPPVPGNATAGNFIKALAELGWLDAVDQAVAQADALSQRLWARASSFDRHDPMLIAVATAIGKTSDDLDALFRKANSY